MQMIDCQTSQDGLRYELELVTEVLQEEENRLSEFFYRSWWYRKLFARRENIIFVRMDNGMFSSGEIYTTELKQELLVCEETIEAQLHTAIRPRRSPRYLSS